MRTGLGIALGIALLFTTIAYAQTYEEIMAQVAHYPGPNEPLYVPGEDEAIWLTDFEGHAYIYDNDSIRINYATWFDQTQVTRTEVYRNGVKMRFLPDMLDTLTNDQMKTFDGNPLEHTPASSHTDHAIWGYEYRFVFLGRDGMRLACLPVRVSNTTRFRGERIAQVGVFWNHLHRSDSAIIGDLSRIAGSGFSTIQTQIYYFMESSTSNELFALADVDARIAPDWARTLSEEELRRSLRLIDAAGLDADLRVEIWLSRDWKNVHGGSRSSISPSNPSKWFANYREICLEVARVAEEEGCDVLCIGVELNSMEGHTTEWRWLASAIREVFSGRLTFSESMHHYLTGFDAYSGKTTVARSAGDFWDALDYIGMNCWRNPPLENRPDQRLTRMTEAFVRIWSQAFTHYESRFPGSPIHWAEIGTLKHDGQAMGPPSDPSGLVADYQEAADVWAAYMIGAAYLHADGLAVWRVALEDHPEWVGVDSQTINPYPPMLIVESFLLEQLDTSSKSWISALAIPEDELHQTGVSPSTQVMGDTPEHKLQIPPIPDAGKDHLRQESEPGRAPHGVEIVGGGCVRC